MVDVIISGAGPAGSIAAIVLARAGVRVLIVDRETFPRDKLCGDTLNPGAVRLLESMGLADGPLKTAWPLAGMVVTGPRNGVEAAYERGQHGLAITRRVLDAWLLEQAVAAGAKFESPLTVKGLLRGEGAAVRGVVVTPRGQNDRELRLPARLTIAADGRRSRLAKEAGLSALTRAPQRWAFGVYATGVEGMTACGEMHIRDRRYIGLAPISASQTNICVVTPPRPEGGRPADVVRRVIASDQDLQRRIAAARFEEPVRVLGPLASEVRAPGMPGLLLAGDAAGFVDPMTGDGMTLAMRGAVLAAEEALRTLEHGDVSGAADRLAQARRDALGGKLRFDRAVRGLVERPAAIDAVAFGARWLPGLVRRAVRYAGDAS